MKKLPLPLFFAAFALLWIAFSPSCFAQTDSASLRQLPLSVLELTARNQDKLIVVEWTSIDEMSLSYYQLEYSSDGKQYKPILKAPASGRAHDAAFKYTITDYPAEQEHHYYRLMAVSDAGEVEEKAMVRIGRSGSLTTTIHPNPAKNTRFPVVIPSDRPYHILLCDASGKVIKEYFQKKKSTLLIPIGDIKEGMHLVRVYRQH